MLWQMLLDFVTGEYVVMFVLKNLKRKRKDMPVKVEERKFITFSQQVGTDGQKIFLFFNLRCKGNNKSSIGM